MAPIAIRRWRSATTRGLKSSDTAGRLRDLTKGLISHLESAPKLVGPLSSDYERVAQEISEILLKEDGG